MTKENTLRLLAHYKEVGRTDAYEDMKAHILNGNKFSKEDKSTMFKDKAEVKTNAKKA